MIDVTITATRRPDVLARTLHSFDHNMLATCQKRAIINIDPIGPGKSAQEIVALCWKYFDDVVYFMPPSPSFPKAFKKVWSLTREEFVFHLEDDWELQYPVDIFDMIATMQEEKNLASLRLNVFRTDKLSAKNWKVFFPWNGRYFECPEDKKFEVGFCGHPSLIRGEFVRQAAECLIETLNPEKQFHRGNDALILLQSKYKFGVWAGQNAVPSIVDIGRCWMIENGYAKAGNKAWFTEWTSQSIAKE